MTFEHFKEIWQSVFKERPPITNPAIIDEGTPRVNAELIKASNGQPNALDEIDKTRRNPNCPSDGLHCPYVERGHIGQCFCGVTQ